MKLLLSEEKINLGRQCEIDYAKAIEVVIMALIHVWEELSYFDCFNVAPTGFWHNLLQFVVEMSRNVQSGIPLNSET